MSESWIIIRLFFNPSPGSSHLLSMDELGKLILTHYPYFSVTIIISTFPT
ncbi:hypothetical protein CISIN_1g0392082mg, partial [Citrus sinensis]